MTSLTHLIEDERKNLAKMSRKIDRKLDKMEGIRMNVNDGKSFLQEESKNEESNNKIENFDMRKEFDSKNEVSDLKNEFSEDDSQIKDSQRKDSKFSFRSHGSLKEEIPSFNPTLSDINLNYEDLKVKIPAGLASIKEEDSPLKFHNEESGKLNENIKKTPELKISPEKNKISAKKQKNPEKDNLNKNDKNNNNNELPPESEERFKTVEDSQKIKELQHALSYSLNKIKFEEGLNSKGENTLFESFEHSPTKEKEEAGPVFSYNDKNLLSEMRSNNKMDGSSSSESSQIEEFIPDGSPVAILKNCDPVKKRLLTLNEGFKNLLLTADPTRKSLPKLLELSDETKAMEYLRNSLGKDISKFVVPIELHEPLSMLQRLCEPYEQIHLLETTESIQSSTLRLAYVMGFAFSSYASCILRVKKPFDSLLGETYEYISSEKKFRYFAEHVSYNPSIIATYCDSHVFKSWTNMNLKSAFYGKYIEYRPIGVSHMILNKNNDHFIWTRPVTNVENILTGSVFVDNYGDMNFTNLSNHETGVLSLNKHDANNEGIKYNVTGYIKNTKGKVIYNIIGRLDKYLKVIEIETQKQIYIWEYKKDLELLNQNQYYFDHIALQLNFLNRDLLKNIANTDSRLRPDIRALEYLDYKICYKEKKRLEEKERQLKNNIEEKGQLWKPKWFVSEMDEVTKLKSYVFVENGDWNKENFIDIF